MGSAFFGYPAKPASQAEVVRATAEKMTQSGRVQSVVWEDLATDGRLIMDEVLEAIDYAELCVFDLTYINDNVLFEAGYALVRGKPAFFSIDLTVEKARQSWQDFALLNPIGFTAYRNSRELSEQLLRNVTNHSLPIPYDSYIEPVLSEFSSNKSLLYCTTFEPFEAASRLDQLVEERRRRGLEVLVSDPGESSLDPLSWYVQKINNAAGVMVHLAGPHRNRSAIHNARHALVAGMARGFDLPALLLAEESYKAPFDFETAISPYRTANECVKKARTWFDSLDVSKEKTRWGTARQAFETPLSGFTFGEHVAENEMTQLDDYFISTSAYEAALTKDAIYVGHRGTGKTASALQAYSEVSSSRENLAVLIKPAGFEFPAVMAILGRLPDYQHDYFFDALWRFILLTEIAAEALSMIEDRPSVVPIEPTEKSFKDYIDHTPFDVRSEVSVRLEQVLRHLNREIDNSSIDENSARNRINEALHTDALAVLRRQLGQLLTKKRRVAVFVDNLDKGWERGADFHTLARLILGLLTARGTIINDFRRNDQRRQPVNVTVAVFLRSDIFNYVKLAAREPDKLPVSTIAWDDPETLRTLIEARYIASGRPGVSAKNLWTKLFVSEVQGKPSSDFILSRVLPRPRDIIYFCNIAVSRALDRGHYRVEESDFVAAEKQYSQYAYEALLVENGVTIPELELALLSFLGSSSIEEYSRIVDNLKRELHDPSRVGSVLDRLMAMSFLGLEVRDQEFAFPEVGSPYRKALVQAKRLSGGEQPRRLQIHPAFHSFLEIVR